MSNETILDIASGPFGGAARFVGELDQYLVESNKPSLRVIGRGHRVTPWWLAQREYLARKAARRIAINNVSFMSAQNNVVLLRNALNFASPDEIRSLGMGISSSFRARTLLIRKMTSRADTIIVPCSAMGDRVTRFVPNATDRIRVRFHPVTMSLQTPATEASDIFVPIVNAPYKQLASHFNLLRQAMARLAQHQSSRIVTTTQATDFPPEIARDPQFDFIGLKQAVQLHDYWGKAQAIYFPTHLEAFGYALAEARCLGVAVIAPNTAQNREIAGAALCGYEPNNALSLADAVDRAMTTRPAPETSPFDRNSYFDDLIDGITE